MRIVLRDRWPTSLYPVNTDCVTVETGYDVEKSKIKSNEPWLKTSLGCVPKHQTDISRRSAYISVMSYRNYSHCSDRSHIHEVLLYAPAFLG